MKREFKVGDTVRVKPIEHFFKSDECWAEDVAGQTFHVVDCDSDRATGIVIYYLDDDYGYMYEDWMLEPVSSKVKVRKIRADKTDNVNHPIHYNQGGIECIDAMRASQGDDSVVDFCVCNAFKYIFRAKHKNGLEDLKKSRWYIDYAIQLAEKQD